MSNYYGNGRSNYIKVSDIEKFKALCDERSLVCKLNEETGEVACFASNDNESGEIPSIVYDDDGNNVELPNFFKEVSKLLVDDYVFIWRHIGNEKLRYFCGYSVAINSKGKRINISLDDIYEKAEKLGTKVTLAQF